MSPRSEFLAIVFRSVLFLFFGAATAIASDGKSSLLDEVGLFESAVTPESFQQAAPHLEDPARDALEDDEDGDGEPDVYRREPFVAPIPFRSPSLGWGGALTGGFIFRIDPDDRDSPPSTAALAGFGSENESFGGLIITRLHIAEDRWRVDGTLSATRINYDFFGVGGGAGDEGLKIAVEAETLLARIQALRRLPKQVQVRGVPLYLGPSISISRTENSVSGALAPSIPSSELDEIRLGFGIHLQLDSRDDTFYPKNGTLSDLGFTFHDSALASDFSYRVWEVSHRRYHELWHEGVLAGQLLGRFTSGDVSFSDLSEHDLRGYERGRYQDKMRLAGELELRQHFWRRIGGTVFAGLGQVASAIDEFDDDHLLWSAGFGLRFQLTEQNRMNYRADAAWGRDGFEFYFSLTEAF